MINRPGVTGARTRAGLVARVVRLSLSFTVSVALIVSPSTRAVATLDPALSQFADAIEQRVAASATAARGDDELAAWAAALTRSSEGDLLFQEGEPAPLMMRTLGLFGLKSGDVFHATPELQGTIDRNLRTIQKGMRDFDTLLRAEGIQQWGQIGVGAWLAYLQLLYRDYFELDSAMAGRWNGDGVRLADQLLDRRLDSGGFSMDSRGGELRLWPTTLAMLALLRAYENQQLVRYEDAAIAAAEALESLRHPNGGYRSSKDGEVEARANTYLANALLTLARHSGERRFYERGIALLTWLVDRPEPQSEALRAHQAVIIRTLAGRTTVGLRPLQNGEAASDPALATAITSVSARAGRWSTMAEGILRTLLTRVPERSGDVAYDYGDAPGYATSVLLAAGLEERARPIVTRQIQLSSWPKKEDFDEVSFGASALLDAVKHGLDRSDAEAALRRYLVLTGTLARADRYYFDWLDWLTGGGGFDYGATVINAQIAHVHLQAAKLGPEFDDHWIDPAHTGERLVDDATEVWDESLRVYRTRADDSPIALLPNAMMILALLERAERGARDESLERAREVVTGLEPLWEPSRGAYAARFDQRGPDGYLSLSPNSYAVEALLALARATGDATYRVRAEQILEFISRDLYADGVVHHHVYKGRRASGSIWCSGCNWRVVHLLTRE